MQQRIEGKTEAEQDEIFGRAAWEFMAADPLATLRRTAMKLKDFWWAGSQVGILYPSLWTNAYLAYYIAVLVFTAFGLVRLVRDGAMRSLAAIALTVVPVSLLQSLYYAEGRHRWEIEPLLLVLAAAGLVAVVGRLRHSADAGEGHAGRSGDSEH